DKLVTGVQTCALPIFSTSRARTWFSSQFARANSTAFGFTSRSWTEAAREASDRPPAPVPQPTSARAPIRSGARAAMNDAKRYVRSEERRVGKRARAGR